MRTSEESTGTQMPMAADAPEPAADAGAAPGVAQALALLESLEGTEVSGHVEVFDRVHRLLQDALATLDGV